MNETFETRRLRFLFETTSGATPKSGEPSYWDGKINWITPDDLGKLHGKYISRTRRQITLAGFESCGVRLAPKGSLVFSKRAPIGQSAILGREATCNQGCFLITPNSEADVRFNYYCLVALRPNIEILGRGSTFMELSTDDFRSVALPFPEPKNQTKIADYLDREISQIDSLAEEKERMLALIEEKRVALVSRAVTRGLNPNSPTKPSGLDWLGNTPRHWAIERGKNLFAVRDERSEEGDEELLTVSHITGVTSRTEKDVTMFKADDMTGYKRCMKDDFVTNTLWAWMGAMGVSPLDGIVSPDYHVYTSKGKILPEFMELLCRSRPFVAEVIRWSKGVWSSRLRLYPENFFEIRFPVPPKDEQEAIVAEIAAYREKTTKLADALIDSIKLLKERRSALISAAVTGKIPLEEMTA